MPNEPEMTVSFCAKCTDKTACNCSNTIYIRANPLSPEEPVNILSPFSFTPTLTAPLGWKCPDCSCIYSPLTPECARCNTTKVYLQYSSSTGNTQEGR